MIKPVEIKNSLFSQTSVVEHESLRVDKDGITHDGMAISKEALLSILLNDEVLAND
jgi:hypothetical protein